MDASRRKNGTVQLVFATEEASVLLELPRQLRDMLIREDQSELATRRLLPRVSTDARVAAEYKALVGDELRQSKLERIDLFETTIRNAEVGKKSVKFNLTPEQYEIWIGFLNDMRLMIGSQLNITEEWDPDYDTLDPDEWLYLVLTSIQCQLIDLGF